MATILNGVKVGVQSWCFRGLKGNEENIKALAYCGVDAIELCGVHVNVNDVQKSEEVLKLYKDNGITISSYGIDGYSNNETALRNKFEFAKKAGIKVMGADPDVDALELIEKLCNEYGIKLAIHNHGRHHRYGSVSQLESIFNMTSKNVGLCLDTGWALDSGEDPVEMIRRFSGRLYGVHLKDFTFDAENKPEEAILGSGKLDLKGVLSVLEEIGFKGYATIEYEGEPENPLESIKKCVESLKV